MLAVSLDILSSTKLVKNERLDADFFGWKQRHIKVIRTTKSTPDTRNEERTIANPNFLKTLFNEL
jgi:hypothetical protein